MEKVLNPYECLFITDVQDAEAAKTTVAKFIGIINDNAENVKVNEWGKRRLAYPINDQNEGVYTVVTFKSQPSFPTELERLFNIDEKIMRSLTLKLDFEPTAAAVAVPEEVPAEEEAVAETAEEPVVEATVAETTEETVAEATEEAVAEETVSETKDAE